MTLRRIPVFNTDTSSTEGARGGIALEPPPPSQASGGPRSPSRGPWVVAGGGLVVALLAVIAVTARQQGAAPPGANATTISPKQDAHIHVRLHASPLGARLVLDGTVLASNPYEADVQRDTSAHALTVSADGYDPRDLKPSFAQDVEVDVSLSPSIPSAPVPDATPSTVAAKAPPAARAPTMTTFTETKQARPQRSIDEEDPYKK
jgi:hypothetical protein